MAFVTSHHFSDQNAGQTKENSISFRCLDNLRQFAATQQDEFWADLNGELFVVLSSFLEESKILYLLESDTALQVPMFSDGLYVVRVLTGERICQIYNLISENECFVSVIVEVTVLPPMLKPEQLGLKRSKKVYTLRITHCIPNRRMWSKVVVRQWSRDGCRQLKQIEIDLPEDREGCFYVDEHFITIYTRTFSVFTCTVCEKMCKTREYAVITGELSSFKQENLTTVKIKCYLGSYLYKLKAFKKVCCNITHKVLVNIHDHQ